MSDNSFLKHPATRWFVLPILAAFLVTPLVNTTHLQEMLPPNIALAVGRGLALCFVWLTCAIIGVIINAIFAVPHRWIIAAMLVAIGAIVGILVGIVADRAAVVSTITGIYASIAVAAQIGALAYIFRSARGAAEFDAKYSKQDVIDSSEGIGDPLLSIGAFGKMMGQLASFVLWWVAPVVIACYVFVLLGVVSRVALSTSLYWSIGAFVAGFVAGIVMFIVGGRIAPSAAGDT